MASGLVGGIAAECAFRGEWTSGGYRNYNETLLDLEFCEPRGALVRRFIQPRRRRWTCRGIGKYQCQNWRASLTRHHTLRLANSTVHVIAALAKRLQFLEPDLFE